MSIRVVEIIKWGISQSFEFEFVGDKELEIIGFSSLSHYKNGSITWINGKKKDNNNFISCVDCAVVQKGVKVSIANQFIAENSKEFFFAILDHFFSNNRIIIEKQNTIISDSVVLGKNVIIGCNCVLDGEIKIGDNTVIEHNVTIINHVSIGSDCIIHSGTVIGKDGFGYSFDKNNVPQKVPHFGSVMIGNRVEIGSNCSIDRGTIDSTTIGDDTKIDNLVLIAHNVTIGKSCIIAGVSDFAGSSSLGDYSYTAPQVCIENKKSIGNNSFVGLGVVVHDNIGDNMCMIYSGGKPMSIKNYRRFL